jgi:hypothetical protein
MGTGLITTDTLCEIAGEGSMSVKIKFPDKYMKEVPNLWSINRSSGKSILAMGRTKHEARSRYNRMASLAPELGLEQDPVVSIRKVACIV